MFKKVKSMQDIETLSSIARLIWREHYIPIIGESQVTYMLDTFQSVQMIHQHINQENYHYYLLQSENIVMGYLAIQIRENELFLSKLYVALNYRGKGYARNAMALILKIAQQSNLKVVTLTVNKNNQNSIAAYHKLGFTKTGECCVDIGHSYVMDDITMALHL